MSFNFEILSIGGPHNNSIAAIATAMKQATTPEFKLYAKQIVANAKRLSDALQSKGYKVVTGGTEVHMLLVDLRSVGLTGAKGEYVLEEISIACNKNTVPGDKSALNPSGIRLGKYMFLFDVMISFVIVCFLVILQRFIKSK